MRAIVIHGTCKAEDLRVADIPIPQGRPGWVVIRIHAAGLNHSEAILRMYEADRHYIHTPILPGIECAGEVVDPSDTPLQAGDRVIALMRGMGRSFDGSYAEYAVVPAACVFKADLDLDWLSLAAIPESYYTAFGSLRQCLPTDGRRHTYGAGSHQHRRTSGHPTGQGSGGDSRSSGQTQCLVPTDACAWGRRVCHRR